MSERDYASIAGVNWSSLKHMAVSPRHYRWRLDHPEERKPSFVLGGAVHCAILEPEKFDERYAVFEGRRAGGAWKEWQDEHAGIEALTPDEFERIGQIVKEVQRHRVAREILRGGRCEEVITWIDEKTGMMCKGRIDYLRPDFVVDIKTTRDVRPARFERFSFDYSYEAQKAFYHDGAVASRLIPGDQNPYLVTIQPDDDIDIAVYQLSDVALAYGRATYQRLLRRLGECIDSDFWPGVAPDLQQLHLPAYAEERAFEIIAEEEGL